MTAALTSTDSREIRKNDRRRSILETAARLFAEHGFAECDMERVSSALKIAKGTLYLYFPTKQQLFLACVDWGMSEMQRVVVEATVGESDPFQKIARAIHAYLSFFDQNPHLVELLSQERAMFRDRKRGAYFEHREELRTSSAASIRNSWIAGRFETISSRAVARFDRSSALRDDVVNKRSRADHLVG